MHRGKSAYTIYKYKKLAENLQQALANLQYIHHIQSMAMAKLCQYISVHGCSGYHITTTEWLHGRRTGPETISHAMTHSAQARTLHSS